MRKNSTFCTTNIYFFWWQGIHTGLGEIAHYAFDLYFLGDIEHFSMYVTAFVFFLELSIQIVCPFLIVFAVFLLLKWVHDTF